MQAWVLARLPELVGPLRFRLIGGGHSNITYEAQDALGRRCVVRRPPLGGQQGNAHDMAREHRVLSTLVPTPVPVPQPRALCSDSSINGAPFYVMDYAEGAVIDNPQAAERVLDTEALRRRASDQVVDVLADLHHVDIDAVGLGDAARRDGFLERQLRRMHGVWERTKTREVPALDRVHAQLVSTAPPQRYTGVVHCDYRLGNIMIDSSGVLTAVLDWELWTLGDVLADLGYLLNNWYEPDGDEPHVWMQVPPTMAGGFASRHQVVERYGRRTGFDLSAIEYYRAFQYWKLAIIAEGVKRRYETSEMGASDVDFDHMARRVIDLVDLAADHLALAGR